MKPKTIKAFVESTNLPPALVRGVVAQLGGWESFQHYSQNIANYSVYGGFLGSTDYSDTVAFARKFKKEILELAKEQAKDFGESSAYTMMTRFGCFKDENLSADYLAELINGRFNDDDATGLFTCVFDGLTLYAAKEVARAYRDLLEQE